MKEAFILFLQQPSVFPEIQAGQQAFAQEEVQRFLALVRGLQTNEERERIVTDLAPYLLTTDSFHAGMLALLCGSLVEQGVSASIAVDQVVELLLQCLQRLKVLQSLPEQTDEALFAHDPDLLRTREAFSWTLMGAMTMLCRDKEARKRWRSHGELVALVEELDDEEAIPYYLRRTLALLDDKELVVLDRLNVRGFLVRLTGVQDVLYHCYALLQHALIEHCGLGYLDAEPTDREAVRYAQNDNPTEQDYQNAENVYDYQRFGFSYPGGLFLPGSASFAELPTYRGTPFLLIEKKSMTFQWQPANMYPVLHEAWRARVELVREMTQAEVEAWMRGVGV